MTVMAGDGQQGQPTEGVVSLESMSQDMDETEAAPGESEEGEESGEPEGVEEAEEGAEETEESEESTFTIKVDGKEVELSKAELIEMGQKGFDYTNKTMALAKEREAIGHEKEHVTKQRQYVDQAYEQQHARLAALEQYMQEQVGTPPPIEWAQQDAAYYLAKKEEHDQRKGQLQQTQQAIQQLQQEQHRHRQAWLMQQAEDAERDLRDTLPGWNEDQLETLVGYVGKFGITPETAELAFVQSGIWKMAHKAKAYDDLLAKKDAIKPVVKAHKAAAPTSTNIPQSSVQQKEAWQRHRAAPSVKSLADLL